MPDFSRRSIILGTAGIAAAGAGVTAAASGLSGSVEGQADVQAEQALTVTDVSADSSGDADATFTRVSDDNTEFQAAIELNNGDEFRFISTIENSAADNLDVQVVVDSPDPIDINVLKNNAGSLGSDIDPDDDGTTSNAIQTGEDTFITTITGGNTADEEITVRGELDDTADPGSYDIGVAIKPLSTDATS